MCSQHLLAVSSAAVNLRIVSNVVPRLGFSESASGLSERERLLSYSFI